MKNDPGRVIARRPSAEGQGRNPPWSWDGLKIDRADVENRTAVPPEDRAALEDRIALYRERYWSGRDLYTGESLDVPVDEGE